MQSPSGCVRIVRRKSAARLSTGLNHAHPLSVLLQAANGVAPGAHVHLKSTSEMLRLTVAYAAAGSFLRALLEWRDLRAAGAGDAYKRQLAAADASSLHTLVDNLLGVPAQLQLDFGDRM